MTKSTSGTGAMMGTGACDFWICLSPRPSDSIMEAGLKQIGPAISAVQTRDKGVVLRAPRRTSEFKLVHHDRNPARPGFGNQK